MTCKVCGAPAQKHIWRCEDHYRCDVCGTTKNLCYYGDDGLLCQPHRDEQIAGRIATFNGNTHFTNEVTCPWCGHRHRDSWEFSEGDQDCGDCGRQFDLSRHVEVTYTTVKIGEQR